MPKRIFIVESIPTNERGKISRRELAKRFAGLIRRTRRVTAQVRILTKNPLSFGEKQALLPERNSCPPPIGDR